MQKNNLLPFSFIFTVAIVSFIVSTTSCRKENILDDTSAKVTFSKDTVMFDTVFVTIGSTYQRFTVTNPYNNTIILSQVRLGNGTASSFRMNVDGIAGVTIKDVEIPPKDSVYVFVEVTIDPSNVNNPFVIEDDIYFTVNGNQQSVHLVAWGQNAYFHYNELACNETWSNDKPHVLYGITAVGFPGLDSNCTLTIPAGTMIYAHSEALLYVYKSKLIVNGTESSPVVFQGDRREDAFKYESGQWFGIRFAIAQNSLLNYAIIKNGTAGIYADTAWGNDSIVLNNVKSYNHSFASVFAQGANINAVNCYLSKAGNNVVSLRLGGKYFFNHCTINNFWTASTRSTPALVLNNYFNANSTTFVRPIEAIFNNTIIHGDIDNEITIDTVPGNFATYRFNHCLVKTDVALNSNYINVKKNLNPRFVSNSNLRLQSSSPLIDQADPLFHVPKDIDENLRSNPADIGCYEYVP